MNDIDFGVFARFGRIDRRVSRRLQFIMPQAEILLRRRNPRVADDQAPPASRGSKETRRSGFFEMKSLSNRHCKENPRLIYRQRGGAILDTVQKTAVWFTGQERCNYHTIFMPTVLVMERGENVSAYAMVNLAVALGWPDDRVLVNDDHQGLSGKTAENRSGFHRIMAEVTMEHVGLVFGIEMSRLFGRKVRALDSALP